MSDPRRSDPRSSDPGRSDPGSADRRGADRDGSDPGGCGATERRPEDVTDALAACSRHGRNALVEALLAARSAVDAVALAVTGMPATQSDSESELRRRLARIATSIDDLIARVSGGRASDMGPLGGAILEALDHEIERWEARSSVDPEARAVLRAFLGLREVLWELGLRPTGGTTDRPRAARASRTQARPASPSRVRRIVVDGS